MTMWFAWMGFVVFVAIAAQAIVRAISEELGKLSKRLEDRLSNIEHAIARLEGRIADRDTSPRERIAKSDE
ncbi:MAG: hypothetical protein ACI9OJ_005944 [Myxococcota bacterium]|jgi:hypothetical protein